LRPSVKCFAPSGPISFPARKMEKRIEGDETLFWKSQKKHNKQQQKESKRRMKNLNKEKQSHKLQKLNSSRLVVSFRNSTMLESTTERRFPVLHLLKDEEKK
jgi:hypothetical protein